MNKSKSERINYLDSAKGIGIILVCLGHSITNASAAIDSDHRILLQFISQFHMPLFFMLSGMVFSERYITNPMKSSLKKFKAYYIPFVVYNMTFVVLHNVMYKGYMFTDKYDGKTFLKKTFDVFTMHIQEICGAMWFLRCLLTIVLLFIWIRFVACKLFGGRYRECITACVVIGLFLFSFWDKCPQIFKVNLAFYNISFYYIGFLIRKFEVAKFINKNKLCLCLIGVVINGIVAMNYTYAIDGIYDGYIIVLRFIVQIIGSMMVIAFVQWNKIANSKLLMIIGKKSLDIMAIHFVCFKLVSYIIIQVYGMDMINMATIPVVIGVSGLWPIVYTIVGLSIPTVVRCLYDSVKINITQRWVR